MPDTWRVRSGFGSLEVSLQPAAASKDAADRSMRELRHLVDAFRCRDPQARRVVLEVYAALRGVSGGARSPEVWGGSAKDEAVAHELAWAARAGRLVVRTREPRPVVLTLDGADAVTNALGPEAEPTAWIAIELVDDEGNPVPDVAYRIDCDDGRVRTGSTDRSGRAKEDGLHDGNCKVSFPGLHGPDWKAA